MALPPLDPEAIRRSKKLEVVLTAAAETNRGVDVLQRVRSFDSARGFAEELIRLGGDPGRLTFEIDEAGDRKHHAALELLSTVPSTATSAEIEQFPDSQPIVLSADAPAEGLDAILGAGLSASQVAEMLIGWAMAYNDVEGMDASETAVFERLIAIRDRGRAQNTHA